jgi:hypothetical protein
MDHIESRNAPSPEAASDDFASLSHSRTGEAPDRLAFEPVPLRHRVDGLTPEKQRAYVEALADTGVAREAAGRVGLSEQSINRVRRRADARSFDHACEAAHVHGARRLRSVAYERAVEGTLKGHYYHGELISQERVYDNRLLIHLLGKTEHLLQPPGQALAICENWEAHMDALEQGAEPPEPEREDWRSAVWEDRETGALRTCFPPPTGFSGDEEGVWDGVNWYSRSLTPEEQASLDVLEAAETARDRATECERRDRFFGFAGDGISSSRQAEPNEASADEGPIEIKSMAGLRLRNPQDRRISGLSRHPGAGWDPGEKPRRAFHPPGSRPAPGRRADPSFRHKPEPMNTQVQGSRRRSPWIPDQVREDGYIQSAPPRHPCR